MAESFNDFIAGYVGGVAGLIVGSPLDVLKVRLQTGSPVSVHGAPKSSFRILMEMKRSEGAKSLFKGVGSPIIGLAFLNSILFASYGGIMRLFERENRISEDRIPLFHVYVAGSGAGAACCLVSTPTELIKCRAQVIKSPVSDNHLENIKTSRTEPGSFEIFKKVIRTQGIRGLYHGGLITIIRDAPGYGLYFWTYEGIKRLTHVTPDNSDYSNVSKLLFAGGMAGVVSWAGVYPLDVIKSRIQTQQRYPSVIPAKPLSSLSVINSTRAISGSFRGIIDCAVRSYHKEGISVFFRGIIPTLVRAWPVNAVTFYIYEVTVDLLKNV